MLYIIQKNILANKDTGDIEFPDLNIQGSQIPIVQIYHIINKKCILFIFFTEISHK